MIYQEFCDFPGCLPAYLCSPDADARQLLTVHPFSYKPSFCFRKRTIKAVPSMNRAAVAASPTRHRSQIGELWI